MISEISHKVCDGIWVMGPLNNMYIILSVPEKVNLIKLKKYPMKMLSYIYNGFGVFAFKNSNLANPGASRVRAEKPIVFCCESRKNTTLPKIRRLGV
jgi:hypothetical protein